MTSDVITDINEAEQGSSLWHDAWLRLRKNKMALFGGVTLLVFIIIAILTPLIAPYSYETQNLDLYIAALQRAGKNIGTDGRNRNRPTPH